MSEQSSPQPSRNRVAISALIVGLVTLVIALGTLFLTIHNRLEQNKLQLLPTTIPSLAKDAARTSMQPALDAIHQQLQQQDEIIRGLEQTLNHLQQKKQLRIDLDAVLIHIEQAREAIAQLRGASLRTEKLQPAALGSTWYQQWWHNIRSLFVVRRLTDSNQILLSPRQIELIKASLELQLDLTAWAAIHDKPDLFKQALTQANRLVQEGFEQSASLVQLQHALQNLQTITWKTVLTTAPSGQAGKRGQGVNR